MIFITGASWSQFQYANNAFPDGPGLADYLSLSNDVWNVGKGGASNLFALKKLEDAIIKCKDVIGDHFFWVVTDPTRDMEEVTDVQSIIDSLHNAFNVANNLAQAHNIIINLVGGECDLIEDIGSYSNLKVIIPSIGRLADNNYPISICQDIEKFTSNTERSEEIVTLISDVYRKLTYMDNNTECFKARHPNSKLLLLVARAMLPEFDKYYLTTWTN